MCVNYYSQGLMNEGDNSSIGIVLCADKGGDIVKYVLPEGNTYFASWYIICIPSEEKFKSEFVGKLYKNKQKMFE